MAPKRTRALVGIAMVGLGVVQAVFGSVQGEPVFSALGLTYALIGAVYYWSEVYAADTGENNT